MAAGLDRDTSDAEFSLHKSGLKGLGTEPLDSVSPSLLARSTRHRLPGRALAPWERDGLRKKTYGADQWVHRDPRTQRLWRSSATMKSV